MKLFRGFKYRTLVYEINIENDAKADFIIKGVIGGNKTVLSYR